MSGTPAHVTPPDDSSWLAPLLDEVRPLLAEARRRGEKPEFLRLSPSAYESVARCKSLDAERGLPLMVLGLQIVQADEPLAAPRVF